MREYRTLLHTCVDPRFDGKTRDFVRTTIGGYVHKSDAGGIKCLVHHPEVRPWVFRNWDLVVAGFGLDRIVLVQHGNHCAGYHEELPHASLEEERAFHASQLRQAIRLIKEWRPGFPVQAFFAFIQDSRVVHDPVSL